jgi:hypothetical protein
MPTPIAINKLPFEPSAIRRVKRDLESQWRTVIAGVSIALLAASAVPPSAAKDNAYDSLNLAPTINFDTDPQFQRSKRASERAKLSQARAREADERRRALADDLEKRNGERRNEHFRVEAALHAAEMQAHRDEDMRLMQLNIERSERQSLAIASGSMSKQEGIDAALRFREEMQSQSMQLHATRARLVAERHQQFEKRMAEIATIEQRERAQYAVELAALNAKEQARILQEAAAERAIEAADKKADDDKFHAQIAMQKAQETAAKAAALKLCGPHSVAAAAKKSAGVRRHYAGRVVDSAGEALSGVIVTGFFQPLFHYAPTNGASTRDVVLECVTYSFEAVTDAKGEYAFVFDEVSPVNVDKKSATGSLVFYLPGYQLKRTALSPESLRLTNTESRDEARTTETLELVPQTVSALHNPHDRRAGEMVETIQRTKPLRVTPCAWARHPELLRTLSIETRRLYREMYRADELETTGFPKPSADPDSDNTQARWRAEIWLDYLLRTQNSCAIDAKSFATAAALAQTERITFVMVDANRFWKPPAPEGRALSMPAVRGRVIDKVTRKPVSGATLFGSYNTVNWEIGGRTLRAQLAQTIDIETGATGAFELPAWSSGSRKLTGAIGFPEWGAWPAVTVYAPGYRLLTTSLNLRSDSISLTPKKITTNTAGEEIIELEPVASDVENVGVASRFMLEPKLITMCVPHEGQESVNAFCEKTIQDRCAWERYPNVLKRQGRMRAILNDPATDRHTKEYATINQLLSAQKKLGARWSCADVESLLQP